MEEQAPLEDAVGTPATPVEVADRAPAATQPPRVGSRRWRGWALLAVTAVLIVGVALLARQAWLTYQDDQARDEVLRAAERAVPDVLSYDHTDLDADLERAVAHLTPTFAAEYRELAEKTIRPTATKYKAVVSAEVLSSGVEAADREQAQVLLFVNQTTRTTELPAPRVDSSRVRVRLVRTAAGWRVSAVEPL